MSLLRIALASLLVGCGSSSANTPPAETPHTETSGKKEVFSTPKAKVYSVPGKPDTYEIDAPDEDSGVAAEYKYLDSLGCQVGEQSLQNADKRVYDVLTVKCGGGEAKAITFDITAFFGKH